METAKDLDCGGLELVVARFARACRGGEGKMWKGQKGSHESSENTYARIYSEWFFNTSYELADKPTLEIYLNDEWSTPKDKLITEIYIPIL